MTRELMDNFSQTEAQEIETATKKKRKGIKSAAPSNESDEFQESENEYNTDDYENLVGFL